MSYPYIPDDIETPSDNAELLSTICIDNTLLVVNTLKYQDKHFHGGKSFRRRDTWISEVDTCVVSARILSLIEDFAVLQSNDLPSDHAPITLSIACRGVDLSSLLARARMLGDHAVLHGNANKIRLCKKPVKFSNINKDLFVENIPHTDPFKGYLDMDNVVQDLSNMLYACAQSSVRQDEPTVNYNSSTGRWERLLNDAHDATVWRAINWKGDYRMNDSQDG